MVGGFSVRIAVNTLTFAPLLLLCNFGAATDEAKNIIQRRIDRPAVPEDLRTASNTGSGERRMNTTIDLLLVQAHCLNQSNDIDGCGAAAAESEAL